MARSGDVLFGGAGAGLRVVRSRGELLGIAVQPIGGWE
jgi:hypothetical protein